MEQISVRKATLKDLTKLLDFEKGIINTERPVDPTLKDGSIHYYDLGQMITDPQVQVVVAELNGELIGSGYAHIQSSKPYLKHQKHAYLGFMYVVEAYRRRGVNNKIIEALKDWCIAQNITELRLEVYNDNLPAIKAYEKTGFKKHMIEMRIGLNDI
ncbi:MAG: family N-acetyltransferase [Mucilaginibacter sp.]|jgi:RimJ/RimL family protein N-acetyltransferase|nr:family N-acetyltransferase [Mucilaginibacter sp.]